MKNNICDIISQGTKNAVNTGVYLDYQASCPLDARVLAKMLPYMTEEYGNPHSSEHFMGWHANEAIETAKEQVSQYIDALPDEIVFTSGATESNNLAIIGTGLAALEHQSSRKTILVSAIEHKCVLGSARALERFGFTVKKIPVLHTGIVDLNALKDLLNDDVLLVSVMATNNEIGVDQPLDKIGELVKSCGAIFHVDAAQTGYRKISVVDIPYIDLLSLSEHKIYGPKGIGGLFISSNSVLKPAPILYGGGQQDGFRSGTLPTFLVVGFGAAADIMAKERDEEIVRVKMLRNKLLEGLKEICPDIIINGTMECRHAGNINVTIPRVNAKQLIYSIQPNVAFSTGSACTSGVIEPSHVLKAIGLSNEDAECSFRMSVGRFSDENDIQKTLEIIKDIVCRQTHIA